MVNDPNAIVAADAVDAGWLTARLRDNGLDVEVASFDAQQIGTGQIGKCVKYTLRYASSSQNGPASIVAKFPSDDPTSRATGVMLKNFLREVRFYQELQSRLSIRTPKCYFAQIIDEGPEFVVLMEDLHPAQQGDQLRGCTPRIAEAAVLELAGLHGPSWCDSSLHKMKWLRDECEPPPVTTQDLYRNQLPGFLDRFAQHLADDEIGIIEAVGAADSGPLFESLPEVFSLVHVDYRLDNLLILERGDDTEVTAVDWQSITLGAPLNDVAYFLGAGLLPEVRIEVEQDIVRAYHAKLQQAGIAFDWADCWENYRRGVFAGFAVTVIAATLVQQTERGDQMFLTMGRRHARHAIDLGGAEFLS